MSELIPHIPGLRRYARLLTGEPTRADDLVQDTLERALRKLHLFDAGRSGQDRTGALRSWLLSVMHNVWASQMRSLRPHDPLADELADDTPDEAGPRGVTLVDPAPDPSVRTALRLDTQRALASLPDTQRAVLLLVVVEELAYAEVAEVLGVPVGTVMSRLSRARAAMRLHLDAPANAVTSQRGSPAKTASGPTGGGNDGGDDDDHHHLDHDAAARQNSHTGARLRVVGSASGRPR